MQLEPTLSRCPAAVLLMVQDRPEQTAFWLHASLWSGEQERLSEETVVIQALKAQSGASRILEQLYGGTIATSYHPVWSRNSEEVLRVLRAAAQDWTEVPDEMTSTVTRLALDSLVSAVLRQPKPKIVFRSWLDRMVPKADWPAQSGKVWQF
ncbi:hypothetical protein [Thiomonas sp.]